MSKKTSRDEAFEALDFIINVLKEHEKDLDRLIGKLDEIAQQASGGEKVGERIEMVEQRLSNIQNEISNLINYISSSQSEVPSFYLRGPPVIVRCKQWEDFKILASNAETVSFLYKEADKTFQADALKNGRVLTYSGEIPKDARLLKAWLSIELKVDESSIFEGVLAIG